MAGLDPAIHVFAVKAKGKDVDGPIKSGHDDAGRGFSNNFREARGSSPQPLVDCARACFFVGSAHWDLERCREVPKGLIRKLFFSGIRPRS